MLTAILATCGTSPTSHSRNRRCAFMRGGDVWFHRTKGSRAATADLELLAPVFHALGGAEDFDAEFAVRFADNFHGMLILDDIACRRVDHDGSAWALAGPALHRVHHLLAVRDLPLPLFYSLQRVIP